MGNKKAGKTRPSASAKTAKAKSKRLSPSEIRQREEKRARATKLGLVIFAVVSLIAIVGVIVIGVVSNYIRSKSLDFLGDDLSRYIYISKEDYSSFTAEVMLDEVRDVDVETALIRKLCRYKSTEASEGGQLRRNITVRPGHEVELYYRGYYLDDNGNKCYFDGGCNFSDSKPKTQEIGTNVLVSQMYVGFEYGLVGKNAADYSELVKDESGVVEAGDIILLKYTSSSGTSQGMRKIIDLSESRVDEIWGEGFSEFFVGKPVGERIDGYLTVEDEEGTTVYMDMTVEAVYDTGDNPLEVIAYAPRNASTQEELLDKELHYEVFIGRSIVYDSPEADDAFVTEKLGLTESDLSAYEGDSLIDKYRSLLREELEEEIADERASQIENALWEHYMAKATVKRLPYKEVEDYYRSYLTRMLTEYENNGGSAYGGIDSYAATQLDLAPGEDWQDYLRESAKTAVKEKLVFYYVMREEGFVPNEEEYEKEYNEFFDERLYAAAESAGVLPEKYDDYDEYLEALDELREELLYELGESYFVENAIFGFALRKMINFATVIEK